jgi:hypothetical protein
MSFDKLVNWVNQNGGFVSPKLAMDETDKNNRSMYAKEKINSGEQLFLVPPLLCIQSNDTAPPEVPLPIQRDYQLIKELLKQWTLGDKSFYEPYLSYLPSYSSFITNPMYHLYFHRQELVLVQKISLYAPLIQQKLSQLDLLIQLMLNEPIAQQYSATTNKSLQEGVLYAYLLIHSRSWNDFGLVPIADLLQHTYKSTMFLEPGTKMVAKVEYEPGQKIFDNYGVIDDMLLYLGFSFYETKENDMVELSLPPYDKKETQLDQFKVYWLSQLPHRKYVLSSKEIYPPIIHYLRIVSLSDKDMSRIIWNDTKPFYENLISLENEVEVIKQLIYLVSKAKNFNQEMVDEANKTMQLFSPSSVHYHFAKLTLVHEKIFKNNIEVLLQNWLGILQVPFDVKMTLSGLFK